MTHVLLPPQLICIPSWANPERNLPVIEEFAARLEVLQYDNDAAAHTGQLRAELAEAGTPIGPYDQMIAGHARLMGLVVSQTTSASLSASQA